MNIKDFIGKVVISTSTKNRYILTEITSPYISAKTEKPNSSGKQSCYCWHTINGDPIKTGELIFEDISLTDLFNKAYKEYCHSKDAYWEEYGYWMRHGD